MVESGSSIAEAVRIETLSENWHPLRKYSLCYRRRDGTTQMLEREVYFNGPGAAVLPFDPDGGTVLLTRQFRAPPFANGDDPWLVEVPAGNVEEGDNPAETVRKEVEQETGARSPTPRPSSCSSTCCSREERRSRWDRGRFR